MPSLMDCSGSTEPICARSGGDGDSAPREDPDIACLKGVDALDDLLQVFHGNINAYYSNDF